MSAHLKNTHVHSCNMSKNNIKAKDLTKEKWDSRYTVKKKLGCRRTRSYGKGNRELTGEVVKSLRQWLQKQKERETRRAREKRMGELAN